MGFSELPALELHFCFLLPPAPARTADWSAIRAGQHLTGKKIEESCGASALHRFTDEVTLLRAIPAPGNTAIPGVAFHPVGTVGSRAGLV